MKDSSALRANSCNESYNETHVSEKIKGKSSKRYLPKRKNVRILILVQAEVDLPSAVESCTSTAFFLIESPTAFVVFSDTVYKYELMCHV